MARKSKKPQAKRRTPRTPARKAVSRKATPKGSRPTHRPTTRGITRSAQSRASGVRSIASKKKIRISPSSALKRPSVKRTMLRAGSRSVTPASVQRSKKAQTTRAATKLLKEATAAVRRLSRKKGKTRAVQAAKELLRAVEEAASLVKFTRSLTSAKRRLTTARKLARTLEEVTPRVGRAARKKGKARKLADWKQVAMVRTIPSDQYCTRGEQLLGKLENRQGEGRVIAVEPWKPALDWKPMDPRPVPPPDVLKRIKALPTVRHAPKKERQKLIDDFSDAWSECEDGGAHILFEVEYPDEAN